MRLLSIRVTTATSVNAFINVAQSAIQSRSPGTLAYMMENIKQMLKRCFCILPRNAISGDDILGQRRLRPGFQLHF
jgi:hypothetical protein